jgi:hypothetical protein
MVALSPLASWLAVVRPAQQRYKMRTVTMDQSAAEQEFPIKEIAAI